MSSRSWRTLPAVQRGHVYVLEASEWNYGDAIPQELLLDLLPRNTPHIRRNGGQNKHRIINKKI